MIKSEFFKTFQERGFFHQSTDDEGLDAALLENKSPAYIGFDCTASSLHVGSLIQIMVLRWLQKCGHKPIVLLGGGTTKVGDPSGKDESRKILDEKGIADNTKGIKTLLEKFIKFGNGKTDAILVNNDDWLSKLNYIEFLRDVGSHFSVNRMLGFDSVKLRLEREQNLSFLEFNYMVLQAYDFVELYNTNKCRIQIGGSDQWGNIVNGIDLGRRMGTPELFGLTTPLITTSNGAKMGKTAQGAIWLTEDRITPYDYWQFWRNTDDHDVGRFLGLFTELPMDEVNKLAALKEQKINEAKIVLANEATTICFGAEAAAEAAKTAQKTFEEGQFGDSLPVVEIPEADLKTGVPAFKIMLEAGLADSGKAAKRLIEGGGAKVNDNKIEDINDTISLDHLNDEGVIKLSAGRKKHALVKVSS